MSELGKLDDAVLLERARRGDRPALETLLERHAPAAAAYAYALTGHREDALDAAQAALLQVAQYVTDGFPDQAFKTCVYVCTHHAAIDLQRQKISRQKRDDIVAGQQKETAMPTDGVERDEILAAMREELAELPQETAAALALYHLD